MMTAIGILCGIVINILDIGSGRPLAARMGERYGGVPYKMAPWAAKMTWEKGDISFYKLLKKVKEMMDPNNIMNPGRLLVMTEDDIKRKEAEGR